MTETKNNSLAVIDMGSNITIDDSLSKKQQTNKEGLLERRISKKCRKDLKLDIQPHPMTLDGVVHFHLTLKDAARPSGCIITPLEQSEWPQMLKITNGESLRDTFVYTKGDHVVKRTFELKLVVLDKVKLIGCVSSSVKYAKIPRQEFDYMIECCLERGVREYMRAVVDDLPIPNHPLALPINVAHHLGLGYEMIVHSDLDLFEIRSTLHDKVKRIYTPVWSVYLKFEEMEHLLENIYTLIKPLAEDERNCIASLHEDHMNQEGMLACHVCQYLARDYFDEL